MGKNMIGAFYQPQRVVCDLSVLKTLPQREVSAGLAEIIKYGPIADMPFFEWIDGHVDDLRACEPKAMAHAVRKSCEIKAHVVGQDEREAGLRAILNFGHTFGHAIEAGLGYGEWLHGEAVGCGMVMAAHLSEAMGLIDAAFVQRLTNLLDRAGLPTKGPVLNANDNAGQYLALMLHDKKSVAGDIQFVLIEGPGKARVSKAPEAMVRAVIDRCCA
jgi:3-dehydroquinate synthase